MFMYMYYKYSLFVVLCCYSLITHLKKIVAQIMSRVDDNSTVRFNIIRRNVWDGSSRAMSGLRFSPAKRVEEVKLTVDYGVSEGEVDNGGPTREFFRLCL